MIVGIILVIIGVGVTAVSYMAAGSTTGNGRYVVAWGAIIVGIAEILRGFGPSKPSQ